MLGSRRLGPNAFWFFCLLVVWTYLAHPFLLKFPVGTLSKRYNLKLPPHLMFNHPDGALVTVKHKVLKITDSKFAPGWYIIKMANMLSNT